MPGNLTAIVYDTETTGLMKNSLVALDKQPRLIEIFARKLRLDGDWTCIGEIEHVVNPGVPVAKEVTGITGITQEMLDNAPPVAAEWPSIAAFFEGADIEVAHNLAYDRDILGMEHRRHGQGAFPFAPRAVCTVEHTVHLKGYRLKLKDLHKLLTGQAFAGAHRARADVDALETCFRRLWEDGAI